MVTIHYHNQDAFTNLVANLTTMLGMDEIICYTDSTDAKIVFVEQLHKDPEMGYYGLTSAICSALADDVVTPIVRRANATFHRTAPVTTIPHGTVS